MSNSRREISPLKKPRIEFIDLESDEEIPEVKVEEKDEPDVIDEPLMNGERVAVIDREYQRLLHRLEFKKRSSK